VRHTSGLDTFAALGRFGAVGLVNTAAAYLVFALLLLGGLHYSIATLAGGLAGVALGFGLHGRFVFPGRRGSFLRFVLVFTAIYGASVAIQAAVRPAISGYLAGALATAITVPLSFFLNRWLVFREGGRASRAR